jgi:GNAT superfamily N-acetyltransferase
LKKSDKELLEALYGRPENTTIFYVAEENNKIVGFIKGRKDKIANLFVDGKQHKRGIGKKLVNIFEKQAKRLGSKQINIRASLYAAPFYEKMMYMKTTGIRNFMGLKIYPMKKKLK